MADILYTIGHSTRSLQELIDAIRSRDVAVLVDVRRYPASRRHPHFSQVSLSRALPGAAIQYRHEEVMGGRRSRRADSPNGAWRSAAFQGYADHANTVGFQERLERVLSDARRESTALMCAEALPWRCHRRIIADHATTRGWRVVHILEAESVLEHELHPQARRTSDGDIIYPPASGTQEELWG